MNRVTSLALGLALVAGLAAGCSKTADVATPTVDANKITNDAAKCSQLATSFTTIQGQLATAATGTVDTAKLQTDLDSIKSNVPDKIKTDLDTIANGIKSAKGATDVAKFVGTPEYTKATTEITTYLTTECTKVGS